MTHRAFALVLTTLCLGASFALRAQTPQATISGIITDTTGAVVPGATVTAVNNANAQRTTVTTNNDGFYVLNALSVGEYVVEAEKAGFRKFVRQRLQLSTAAPVPLDIQLSTGDVSETVSVTGETPLLQARTSEVSQTIETRAVQDLPLGDRRTLNIIQISGGAARGNCNFALKHSTPSTIRTFYCPAMCSARPASASSRRRVKAAVCS